MQINMHNDPVQVDSGLVVFTLEDQGGAHVEITLAIAGFPPIKHTETFQGAREVAIKLPSGKYAAAVIFQAYVYEALNSHYETAVRANGTTIAEASGDVPAGQESDFDFRRFEIQAI